MKFKKPKISTGSMDSMNAYYRRFCERHIHDPLFDCCCQVIDINNTEGDRDQMNDCTNELNESFTNISINESPEAGTNSLNSIKIKKRRKKSAGESSKSSTSSTSKCTRSTAKKYFSTSDLTLDSSKNYKCTNKRTGLDIHVNNINLNHQFVTLKNHIEALSSSIPDLSKKKLNQISDHDKKILSRMVMKRKKEVAMIEDAQLAREYWEKEKEAREKFIQEQNYSYFKTIKEKRAIELVETKKRVQKIEVEERAQIERLKQELAEKEAKTEALLKTLEMRKEMKVYQKRQRDLQKMDVTLLNQQEQEINSTIWRQIMIERLQQRIHRADNLRHKVMEVYKCRIQTDNQLEQTIHALNYDETKKMEEFRMQQLRQKLQHRDEKYKQFADHRSREIEESQRKAKISAAMRELIKRSISPENLAFRMTGRKATQPDRPISNLSHCDSHFILG